MPSQIKFEEVLEKDNELFFTNVGYSMYPLIKQREDILHIIKIHGIYKFYTIITSDMFTYQLRIHNF